MNSRSRDLASEETKTHCFVVGIGASAGGLRALEEFFDNMPADSGAALLWCNTYLQDFKSLMKELRERSGTRNDKRSG